jgi:hypothetical protein
MRVDVLEGEMLLARDDFATAGAICPVPVLAPVPQPKRPVTLATPRWSFPRLLAR